MSILGNKNGHDPIDEGKPSRKKPMFAVNEALRRYLNNNGRNWRQLYKAYVDKVNAEKKAKQN